MLNTITAPAAPLTLRPYQKTCVERVLTAYHQQPLGGKTLIVLPTGGGKTVVFVEIARCLNLNTLVIAHRQELLQQAADKFRLVDPMAVIGQVGAGRHEWGAPITVASIQTISRPEHLKALQRFGYGLVIIDECHHACAESYQTVLDMLAGAFVVGVTATPDRLDKRSIEQIFGEPVFWASIIDMVEQGYLCDIRAIAVRTTTSLDTLHIQAGDFKTDELEEVIDTPERNERIVKAYLEHCKGRQALCFGVTVKHVTHLCETFNLHGVSASVISGETLAQERRRILHEYERGALEVVCNVEVLTEGVDLPQTACIILARPTQSRSLYTQIIGRGTRLAPGKRDCVVLDITDNCFKHRLQPQTLSRILETSLNDGESITEATKRKQREAEEREQEERTTKVTRRAQDLVVNVLARMDWRRLSTGTYLLEVGKHKHKIMLVPSQETEGYYSVWAKLAPTFQAQQWLKESPLDWAQQHAEMKARILQSDEKKRILVDSNAPWRAKPATARQVFLLRQYGIAFSEDITAGEASDCIGRAIEERKKLQAEQRKKTPTKRRVQKRARASA